MSDESTNKPPYLPYTTFKNIITGLNKNGLIPARIDKTVLSGQSGGTQSYIWAALRFLGLIDEGKVPTDDLKALARAEGEERKKLWREIFERAFAPIIGDLDLPTATLGMLHEKFAAQGLTGETVRKCHSFYSAAAEDAGIVLPPQLKASTRVAGGARKPRKKSTGKQLGSEPEDEFGDDGDGNGNGHEASQVATLLLDREGKRSVKLKAPPTITKAELERIQAWLSFQLIVED
ncbi:MAG: hypothetical protein QOH88_1562 [Verrucomicrobiota bacterium]|jgi:hypothetical protein